MKIMKKQTGSYILIGLLIIMGLSLIVGLQRHFIISKARLEDNITKSVQNQDGELFLKQFDQDSQDLKFADIGSQSVVEQWHDHASLPLQEIGEQVVNERTVGGTSVHYKFYVESKKVLGLFDSYYLVAKPTSVDLTSIYNLNDLKFTFTNNGKKQSFKPDELKQGLFPGKYKFTANGEQGDRQLQGDFYFNIAGDHSTFDMELYYV